MKLTVNGETIDFMFDPVAAGHAVPTVADLLQYKGIEPKNLVIELNGTILAADGWDAAEVTEGARVEILRFVGGG